MSAEFFLALSDVCGCYEALRPPNRVPVSQGAAENLVIKRPGGATTNWNPRETPYMVEPTNLLASRIHSAVCFVGPAQTGKTVALGEGWMAHAVVNDPGDMLIVQMTETKAREYSKQRIGRAMRNSPKIWALRGPSPKDDNLHDKQFKHGMWLKIAWPTVTNLSSTSYRYVFITDYDRIDDDIDGEGDAFTLGSSRPKTYLSRGKIAVESSPGRPILDPHWTPATPHEAPPVTGILGIYNRGDRRRWQWKCPHCGIRFEAKPGMGLFQLPSIEELLTDIRRIDVDKMARQYSRVVCPLGCVIGSEHKEWMNQGGIWLPEGVKLDSNDRIVGDPRTSNIGSFWLGGVAATYITWENLIRKELQAIHEYVMTGNELPWQATVNTDQGMPYLSRALSAAKSSTRPEDRQDPTFIRRIVPRWARFLVATVDVQGGLNARFIVQVHAYGEGMEQVPIDRYVIVDSKRSSGEDRFHPVDPASHPEDWDVLTDRVINSTYPIEGTADQELQVHLTVVDTGGEHKKKQIGEAQAAGVTEKAYAWWRRLRREGKDRKVMLVKGAPSTEPWLIREVMAGGKSGRGDVPLHKLNSNLIKDMVTGAINRKERGPTYYHFPGWLTKPWFEELTAEIRNADGTYTQIRARNEAFDLSAYGIAGCIKLKVDGKSFWIAPPRWALPLDAGNSNVMTREDRREIQANERVDTVAAVQEAPARPVKKSFRRSAVASY